jgi:AraC family transcriptional regulator
MAAVNPVGAAMVESQSHLRSLIRRAVSFLDRDRSEAWRCLRDADALLGRESFGETVTRQIAPPVRPGCLAAWQSRRVTEYIEEHLESKLTVKDIAAAIELSKSHFTRAFKRTLGTSPMVYIAARRVERAKHMMIVSTESLTEIALNCGFADQSHLNRQFRRAVGVTPGQWRRSSASAPGTIDRAVQPAVFRARPSLVARQRAGIGAVS